MQHFSHSLQHFYSRNCFYKIVHTLAWRHYSKKSRSLQDSLSTATLSKRKAKGSVLAQLPGADAFFDTQQQEMIEKIEAAGGARAANALFNALERWQTRRMRQIGITEELEIMTVEDPKEAALRIRKLPAFKDFTDDEFYGTNALPEHRKAEFARRVGIQPNEEFDITRDATPEERDIIQKFVGKENQDSKDKRRETSEHNLLDSSKIELEDDKKYFIIMIQQPETIDSTKPLRAVADWLMRNSCNLEDSQISQVGTNFSALILVLVNHKLTQAKIEAAIKRQLSPKSTVAVKDSLSFSKMLPIEEIATTLRMSGPYHNNVLPMVSQFLAKCRAHILSLDVRTPSLQGNYFSDNHVRRIFINIAAYLPHDSPVDPVEFSSFFKRMHVRYSIRSRIDFQDPPPEYEEYKRKVLSDMEERERKFEQEMKKRFEEASKRGNALGALQNPYRRGENIEKTPVVDVDAEAREKASGLQREDVARKLLENEGLATPPLP